MTDSRGALAETWAHITDRIAPVIAKELNEDYDAASSNKSALLARKAATEICPTAMRHCVGENQQYESCVAPLSPLQLRSLTLPSCSYDQCYTFLTEERRWGEVYEGGLDVRYHSVCVSPESGDSPSPRRLRGAATYTATWSPSAPTCTARTSVRREATCAVRLAARGSPPLLPFSSLTSAHSHHPQLSATCSRRRGPSHSRRPSSRPTRRGTTATCAA